MKRRGFLLSLSVGFLFGLFSTYLAWEIFQWRGRGFVGRLLMAPGTVAQETFRFARLFPIPQGNSELIALYFFNGLFYATFFCGIYLLYKVCRDWNVRESYRGFIFYFLLVAVLFLMVTMHAIKLANNCYSTSPPLPISGFCFSKAIVLYDEIIAGLWWFFALLFSVFANLWHAKEKKWLAAKMIFLFALAFSVFIVLNFHFQLEEGIQNNLRGFCDADSNLCDTLEPFSDKLNSLFR